MVRKAVSVVVVVPVKCKPVCQNSTMMLRKAVHGGGQKALVVSNW